MGYSDETMIVKLKKASPVKHFLIELDSASGIFDSLRQLWRNLIN